VSVSMDLAGRRALAGTAARAGTATRGRFDVRTFQDCNLLRHRREKCWDSQEVFHLRTSLLRLSVKGGR
jgi:hypothetical protein